MNTQHKLSVPPPHLRRGAGKAFEDSSIDSDRHILTYMTEALGHETLADARVLDMGCGTKFTQAILGYDIPIGEYIGVDVFREMIQFLSEATVGDDR